MAIVGAESVVYEGTLDGNKVAVKKPILSTTEDINKFHKELQLLWYYIFVFACFEHLMTCTLI